jgi:hypothetical protein
LGRPFFMRVDQVFGLTFGANTNLVQNALNPCGGSSGILSCIVFDRVKTDSKGLFLIALAVIPRPALQPHDHGVIADEMRLTAGGQQLGVCCVWPQIAQLCGGCDPCACVNGIRGGAKVADGRYRVCRLCHSCFWARCYGGNFARVTGPKQCVIRLKGGPVVELNWRCLWCGRGCLRCVWRVLGWCCVCHFETFLRCFSKIIIRCKSAAPKAQMGRRNGLLSQFL